MVWTNLSPKERKKWERDRKLLIEQNKKCAELNLFSHRNGYCECHTQKKLRYLYGEPT